VPPSSTNRVRIETIFEKVSVEGHCGEVLGSL
jgi:hypothetical protein